MVQITPSEVKNCTEDIQPQLTNLNTHLKKLSTIENHITHE